MVTKKKTPARVPVASEAIEQRHLAQWLDTRGVWWCHPANGEWRNIVTARRLKAMGVRPGVPDILIFTPPPKGYMIRTVGVAIELKSESKTARVSPEQKAWLDALGSYGWVALVAHGAREAIRKLLMLGY